MVNVAEDRNTPMEPSDEALCRRAADGSREAEEALVRRYSGLVRSCARPLFLAGGDSEDLIQEGMFGLIRAIREYDGAKAASFRTFAEVCIRNRLISALRAASRDKHSPLNSPFPWIPLSLMAIPIRSALCAPPPPIRRSLSSTATAWPRRLRAPESSCPSSRRRS